MFAFLTPSAGEMLLLLVVGVLLFGRDLPDVGRKLGRTLAQFRRGLQDFKDQLDRDTTIRELRDTVRDVKQAAAVPRQLADPATALRDLAHDAMHAPIDQPVNQPIDQPVDQPTAAAPPAATPAPAAEAPPAAPAPDPATDGRRSD